MKLRSLILALSLALGVSGLGQAAAKKKPAVVHHPRKAAKPQVVKHKAPKATVHKSTRKVAKAKVVRKRAKR